MKNRILTILLLIGTAACSSFQKQYDHKLDRTSDKIYKDPDFRELDSGLYIMKEKVVVKFPREKQLLKIGLMTHFGEGVFGPPLIPFLPISIVRRKSNSDDFLMSGEIETYPSIQIKKENLSLSVDGGETFINALKVGTFQNFSCGQGLDFLEEKLSSDEYKKGVPPSNCTKMNNSTSLLFSSLIPIYGQKIILKVSGLQDKSGKKLPEVKIYFRPSSEWRYSALGSVQL